ncbi:unnamed protein product, partial [Rotaria sp. Silwood1]
MTNPIQGESFALMYEQNRTAAELLFHHASLDLIEDYEIYSFYRRLNRSTPISSEQLYQSCEPPAFGDSCQYRFLLNNEFLEIVNNTFNEKRSHHPTDILMITNGTCYQELQCQGSIICLDWREVCDVKSLNHSNTAVPYCFIESGFFAGYLQCPNGKDEEHCHELEMNECDALTEYRCKNGHCIPQELFLDRIPDCPDKSDENGLLSYNHSSCQHVSLFHCPNSSKCISRHRIQDDSLDCFNGEDEIFDGICDQLPHRFRCNIDQQCLPRRFLMDFRPQCKDGSDEAFGFRCTKPLSQNCDILAGRQDTNKEIAFAIICNGIQELRSNFKGDDTDETDCKNASICISPFQICDCRRDCPFNDDEERPLCPWNNSSCLSIYFPCTDVVPEEGILINSIYRCDGETDCINGEDEWLCDLIDQSESRTFTSKNLLDFVPILPKNNQIQPPQSVWLSWYCNRGILVKSTIQDKEFKCLCPPAYYGDRCEYQRKRLNVILELRASTMIERTSVFKLLIFLVQKST